MAEHSRRYSSRLWTGRTLLVLAVVLYTVALVVPECDYRNELVVRADRFRFWHMTRSRRDAFDVLYPRVLVLADAHRLIDLLSAAAAAGLALGRVRFARSAAVVALFVYWGSFAALGLLPGRPAALVSPGTFAGRGFLIGAAVVYLVALAAFVTPRRPRPPEAN
jgi:hypothetical protein